MGRWIKFIFLNLLLMLCVVSCSTWLPPSPITVVVHASKNMNPDILGRPTPVVVTIVQMANQKAVTQFENADFMTLTKLMTNRHQSFALAQTQIEVPPGKKLVQTIQLMPKAAYFGVFAGYRILEPHHWRFVSALSHTLTETQLIIYLNQQAMSLVRPKE